MIATIRHGYIPITFVTTGPTPLRQVYASKSFHHLLQLQLRYPGALIALPLKAHITDMERYSQHLRMPLLCARISVHYPLYAPDIVAYSPCNKLIVGRQLLEVSAGKDSIVGCEEIQLVSPAATERD